MKTSKQKRAKKLSPRASFESLRKPLAPPGHPLGRAKPEERAHPSRRKVKHKQRPEGGDE